MIPNYLVQSKDGVLHGYVRLDVLLCDLATNRNEKVSLFELVRSGFTIRYVPITEDELRTGGGMAS